MSEIGAIERRRSELVQARDELATARAELERCEARVERERLEVEALDRLQPGAADREVFRDAVRRLPRERRELREAIAARDAAGERLGDLDRRLAEVEEALRHLAGLDDELRGMVEAAGGDPDRIPSELGERFVELVERERAERAECERLGEATRLTRRAERLFRGAERRADRAMALGYVDVLVGGLLTSWFKLSSADEAKRLGDEGRAQLSRVRALVHELPTVTEIVPEISGLTRVVDYALDGWIEADLVSLAELSRLRDAVVGGRKRVTALHRRLGWLLGRATRERSQLERERRALLDGVTG